MADFKLGPLAAPETVSKVSFEKRHYKKDSRYLLDLYTLTFDEDQTLEKICPKISPFYKREESEFNSLSPGLNRFSDEDGSNGPASLQMHYGNRSPWLETNLHKILARKIQNMEEVSFEKTKLLTKAYYKLLSDIPAQPFLNTNGTSTNNKVTTKCKKDSMRIPLQTLVTSDLKELKRIINGLTNAAKALNEYLMDLLIEKDDLGLKQNKMLEEISDMTDKIL